MKLSPRTRDLLHQTRIVKYTLYSQLLFMMLVYDIISSFNPRQLTEAVPMVAGCRCFKNQKDNSSYSQPTTHLQNHDPHSPLSSKSSSTCSNVNPDLSLPFSSQSLQIDLRYKIRVSHTSQTEFARIQVPSQI
jgi:hypothetical protein